MSQSVSSINFFCRSFRVSVVQIFADTVKSEILAKGLAKGLAYLNRYKFGTKVTILVTRGPFMSLSELACVAFCLE